MEFIKLNTAGEIYKLPIIKKDRFEDDSAI